MREKHRQTDTQTFSPSFESQPATDEFVNNKKAR